MRKSILLISFDFIKEEYCDITYSIGAILSSLKNNRELEFIDADHYGINLSELYDRFDRNTYRINQHIKDLMLNELKVAASRYDYLAIGVTTWSNIHVDHLVNDVLKDFKGKIILGGYEITAMTEDQLLKTYPEVDYFIKGYAETALKNILRGRYEAGIKIIEEQQNQDDLISPYLTGVLPLNGNKIHWETKRGCPYSCGFCEWGNAADKKVLPLDPKRLNEEINLFKNSSIQEINILDGTFNYGDTYLEILEKLLRNTTASVTMQTRFENIKGTSGDQFINLCKRYSNRVKLEFGLQTIHQLEMKVIGRGNRLSKVTSIMNRLNESGINYEVSLIYGIPGQTYQSFFETVKFVSRNGCPNIRAFPLRIPRNSKMEKLKVKLGVEEAILANNVEQVTAAYSFKRPEYDRMQVLADQLRSGELSASGTYMMSDTSEKSSLIFKETNPYELKMKSMNHHLSRMIQKAEVSLSASANGEEKLPLSA